MRLARGLEGGESNLWDPSGVGPLSEPSFANRPEKNFLSYASNA